jgi:hypothetical protein
MKKIILAVTLIFFLSACAADNPTERPYVPSGELEPSPGPEDFFKIEQSNTPEPGKSPLPVIRKAPELENDVWLNTDGPLRLANLRGKVVLIDMWTFG